MKWKPVGAPSSRKDGAHAQRRLRAIAVGADVLFARPDDFDRPLEGLGHLDRLGQFVVDGATAEPAAEEAIVDEHRLALDPARFRSERERRFRSLRAHPYVDAVCAPMRGRVERFHRRMRQIGNFVHGLDRFGGLGESRVDIAVAAAVSQRPVERRAIFGSELRAIRGSGWAEVPFDRHRMKRFLGAPEIVGDDRHAIGHRHGGENSATPGDSSEIIGFELAAEHRAVGDSGIGHVRQTGVDSEARRAGDLERRIDALDLLADQLELVGRLDRGLLGERDLGGVRREFAEGRQAPRGFVPHDATAGDARGGLHAPSRRRRSDEPRAGGSARLLQVDARAAHRPRAPGSHRLIDIVVDEVAVGGSVFDLHLGEVAFQLLGDNHRHRGQDALAHVGLGDPEGDGIVRVDDDEGVDLVRRLAGFRAPGFAHDGGRAREFGRERSDREAAGGGEAGLDEGASGKSDRHRILPQILASSAARCTAARMRG